MENNYEWQAIIGVAIFVGSWIALSKLRRFLNGIKIRKIVKAKKSILKAYNKLGDD